MIYFLFGPDTYRSRQKLKEIIKEYKKRHQSGLNFIKISFDEKEFNDFKRAVETVSMFDEKKLIVLEEVFQRPEYFQKELLNYLEKKKIENDKDCIAIFRTKEVKSENKLFQFLKKKAKIQEFKLLEGYQLKNWLKNYVEKQNGCIENQAVEKLVDYISSDLWRMSNELDKLIAFNKRKIKAQDIEQLVKPKIDINIFNIIDSLGQKNKKQALKLVHNYFEKGESEIYLLNRFIYQFRNLIKIRDLLDRGTPFYSLAKKSGLHSFIVKKTAHQVENFDFEDLKKIYRKLLATDLDIKTGKIDSKTALEIFIVNL